MAQYPENPTRISGYIHYSCCGNYEKGKPDDKVFYSEPLAFLRFRLKTAMVHFSGLEMSGFQDLLSNSNISRLA